MSAEHGLTVHALVCKLGSPEPAAPLFTGPTVRDWFCVYWQEARRPREQLLLLMGLIADNRRMRSYLGLPRAVDLVDKIGFRRVGYVLGWRLELLLKVWVSNCWKSYGSFHTIGYHDPHSKMAVGLQSTFSKEIIHRSCLSNLKIWNQLNNKIAAVFVFIHS